MDQTQVEQFKRDGFLVEQGVLDPTTVEELWGLAGAIRARTRQHLYPGARYWYGGGQAPADASPELRAAATWGINEITRPFLFDARLVDVFAQPRIDAALHALLGPEPRAWGIKILWTPTTADYDLHWHRDQVKPDLYDWVQYKPEAQDHVQFNLALHDDACFIAVPGSHRRKLTEEEWHAVREAPTADLPGQVVAELGPGDIVWMDAHTLHRGRSSLRDDRLTLHYSAQAQWVPLEPWGAAEDFAWITSDEFISQLAPRSRPYYERLRTATRTADAMEFLKAAAMEHGWQPVDAARTSGSS